MVLERSNSLGFYLESSAFLTIFQLLWGLTLQWDKPVGFISRRPARADIHSLYEYWKCTSVLCENSANTGKLRTLMKLSCINSAETKRFCIIKHGLVLISISLHSFPALCLRAFLINSIHEPLSTVQSRHERQWYGIPQLGRRKRSQ